MTGALYNVNFGKSQEFFGFYLDDWLFAFSLLLVVLFLYITIEISKRFKPTFYLQNKKEFEERNGYSYDYVFVFKVHQEEDLEKLNPDQLKFSMKNIVDRLENAGLGIKCFYSCQRDEIYVKVRADPERLLAEAARTNYKLLLDPENLKIAGESGKKIERRYIWRPFTISNEKQPELFDPYTYIFGKYCTDPAMQSLYTVYKVNPHDDPDFVREQILKPVDRIKLLLTIFEANVNESPPGCGLTLSSMEANGVVLSHFPLHDFNQLVQLQRSWVRFFSWKYEIPLDEVRDYFGEKIGLYFAFLEYYVQWLRIPAVLGIFVYGWNTVTNSNSTYIAAIFGAVFVVWCTLIAENWKGEQKTIAMKWGTTGFEDEETERSEFKGVHTPSPIDGSETLYYSSSNRLYVSMFINSVIGSFIALAVVGCVIMVQLQEFLTVDSAAVKSLSLVGRNYSAYVTSAVLVILIEVFRRIYWKVAVWLNDIQNHRTETNYEDGLVFTVFIFQFANNYFYPIWLAFGKPFSKYECSDNDCIEELQQSLLVLTFFPVFVHCIEEVVIGKIFQLKKLNEETSDLEPGVQVGHIEQQYILAQYNVLEGSFRDYSAVMSTFGYVSMFVAAFPNGVLIALISTEVRMRIDGWKLCQAFRRPQPKIAEDIGIWETVMNFLSIIAVTITYGIICFSQSYLIDTTWSYRWVYFLVLEHITIMIKYYLILVIDDIPEEVDVQLKRQDFIVSKVIDDEEDETEDVFKSNQHAQDFRLAFYDEDFDIPLPPGVTEVNLSVYELMEMKKIEVFPYVEPEKEQEAKEE